MAYGIYNQQNELVEGGSFEHISGDEDRRQLEGSDILPFIFAGNSTFTLVSKKTGVRFTYKVSVPKFDARNEDADTKATGPWFVKVLSGSDNESDYSFLGTVFDKANPRCVPSKKSRIGREAPSRRAFEWFLLNHFSQQIEVWHEGKCGRCGRKLTVPSSIENGLGPICAGLV